MENKRIYTIEVINDENGLLCNQHSNGFSILERLGLLEIIRSELLKEADKESIE